MSAARRGVRPQSYLLLYLFTAGVLLLAHGPLLQLPFYWDEIGQFVPAALDLFHSGQWIPHSTLPNVHPPGVMAYLAGVWHLAGYSLESTRVAMLLLAAAGALFTFLLAIELSRGAPGAPAFAAVAFLFVSPLFFAQAMLAQLDMPAMCFAVLALLLFLQNRFPASAIACVALVLTKETGIAAPALFGIWLIFEKRPRDAAWFLLPGGALLAWLFILKHGTGHWLGNSQFTDYNLFYPLHPVRFGFALLRRLYYLFLSTGHFIGTAVLGWAVRRIPLFRDRAWGVAAAFVAAHVLMVCALGGAVLERYLLPVLPVVYIAFAISFWRLQAWKRPAAMGALLLCLACANFINPVYPFPFENNFAFASFVELQAEAAASAGLHPGAIATMFPMTDALRRPECGYVLQKRDVILLRSFSRADLAPLRTNRPDVLIVFDTVWDPFGILASPPLNSLMERFYGYQRPLRAEEIAAYVPMRIERQWRQRGLSASLLVR